MLVLIRGRVERSMDKLYAFGIKTGLRFLRMRMYDRLKITKMQRA